MGFERRTPDPRLLSPVPSCSCCHVLSPPFPLLSWEHHQRHPGCTGLVAQLRPPGRDAQPGIHHRLLRAQRHHPAPGDHHGPLWPAAHTADWQVRWLGQALGTRRAGSGAAGGGEEGRLSVFSRPPPRPPHLCSASFAASCTLMALASRDTRGERSGLLCPHEKRMSGMKVAVYPSSRPWPPAAPKCPRLPLFPSQFCLH